ncbi:MAG TPA: M23 family peptidase [Flavobacterium sp.]|nr:M23 family peptidase [Flavobacterium sp.]
MKLFFLVFIVAVTAFSQNYPKDYFRSPLDIPLEISGSFGELRSNHFHSGLDFKTKGVEGLPIFAAADGYVSRIKISTFGYGKAIYITHPNGYTTVYGHLQKANGKIQDYIIKQHYKEQSFEIEVFLKPTDLPVLKGEIIAFSGNTGGSAGAHLHFEIRDTKSEMIINPLHFGFDTLFIDTFKPKIENVVVYPLQDSIVINDKQIPQIIPLTTIHDGTYIASKISSNGAVGFGINVFDYMTNPYNKNGIYKIATFVNGVPYFDYTFDTFSFDETKHVNYLIDYYRFKKYGQRFQKLFFQNEYPLSIINHNKKNGILKVQPAASYIYKVIIEDFSKNKTVIEVPITFKNYKSNKQPITSSDKKIKANNEYIFETDKWTISFAPNTFYEDFKMKLKAKDSILYLHEDEIPVKNNFSIAYNVSSFSTFKKEKSFIAYTDGANIDYIKTHIKGDKIYAYAKKLGTYKVVQDSLAPKIYAPNFTTGKIIDALDTIRIKIDDDSSGIATYNAFLNGKWILMEYDFKTNKLIHQLSDGYYLSGKNDFKLVVTDKMNNSTTFESYFYKNN